MAKRAVLFNRFDGGWAADQVLGQENSFAFSKHLDFRKSPSQMSVLPGTRKDSGGTVVDLVQNMVMTGTGTIYSLGHLGWFYKRTTAGAWSPVTKLDDGAYGLVHRPDLQKIFIASKKTVSEYSRLGSSPSIKLNKFASSVSTDTNAVEEDGTSTVTVETAIVEGVRREFSSDIEPLVAIELYIPEAGTGDWTVTVHDPLNNVLESATIVNASIVEGAWNKFTIDQTRLLVKPNALTYHFHVTSTVADGTLQCATGANDCNFRIYADRLVETKNGMHPMAHFLQYVVIGNGNYVSAWEPLSEEPSNAEWLRHRLTFPPDLEVCGLAVWNEYLAIATERKSDSGDPQGGVIFFWDGLSDTYSTFIEIPEGSPYGLHEYKNVLYYFAGGAWFAYAGGETVKIWTMPDTDSEFSGVADSTIVYPYMATVRRGIHLLGFPSYTTNTGLRHCVYSYGAVNKNFDNSFGLSYTLSTGTEFNTSGNLKIGMVRNYGDTLFTSWQDGANTYGVDVVDNTSDPASAAEWHSLVYETGLPGKDEQVSYVQATCSELPEDATITMKYRLDRNGAWVTGGTLNTEDRNYIRLDVNKRFKELQIGFDVVCDSETVVVTSVSAVIDTLSAEKL